MTDDKKRGHRHREVRSSTINFLRLNKAELQVLEFGAKHATPHWRPLTRGDCSTVPRPCPYVGCKHNLYLDVKKNGNLILNYPDLEPEEMVTSCTLDVADQGSIVLEEVAVILNLTRERIRQVEVKALMKLEKTDIRFER